MFDRISQGLWWDKAWSLVSGCTPVSPACANCWAAKQTHMWAKNPNPIISDRNSDLTSAEGQFNGQIRLNHEFLDKPLRIRKPTAWAVWNDLFHEDVPEEFFRQAYEVMRRCPQHIFILLTKRPSIMAQAFGGYKTWPLPNVWLGVTAENQQTADERIPILLQIPAAVRFVSVEPMLGPVNLECVQFDKYTHMNVLEGCGTSLRSPCQAIPNATCEKLNWVICGGESGPGARPMHPEWVRSLRDQCKEARVPFFFKQWGEWFPRDQWEHNPELVLPDDEFAYHNGPGTHVFEDFGDVYPVHRVGKKAGRLLDGVEYLELPEVKA